VTVALISLSATGPRRLTGAALHGVFEVLAANPWAPLVEMTPDTRHLGGLHWHPYDRDAAAQLLDGSDAVLVRESAAPDAVDGSVFNKVEDATTAVLFVPASRTSPDDPRLRAYLAHMISTLPSMGYASILHTESMEPYPSQRLPPPLHRAPWCAVLARGYYERWFDREVLLATPALSAVEDANGAIWLQLYRELVAPNLEDVRVAYEYLDRAVRS
jgi:hypothetical protein